MALNIVRMSGDNWDVVTLEDNDYRETPKQFRFDIGSNYFKHVDKDMEGLYAKDWGYVFSRTLSVRELKEIYIDHFLSVYQYRYDDAKKELEKFNKLKNNLD